ncbi:MULTISPECIES: hypothetical protein [Prochlorococcus]|uniref:Uncharacterized protein n=1 Tax=Prochlorococcus marinus str. MIT 9116 TaxID=167544 RepID=A0A0A1ZVL6_PROMR|nr:hypothetical protein [Prochlorococcus marinus]KGF89822.1 hypothetical protein EU92_1613 [Prochlorococcus marinus str. MIT 9107]KGF92329.1 hypothetical protein EU93_0593 [Prochlorococcus marinus str. MIT 9116]KGF92647.1 hypothetical protein EU94_1645 [Prochlorococcus marinus str. MIT 9123]
MLKVIVTGLIIFLVYSNPTFRTYTLEALKSVTRVIQQLPTPNNNFEESSPSEESEGYSTYEDNF